MSGINPLNPRHAVPTPVRLGVAALLLVAPLLADGADPAAEEMTLIPTGAFAMGDAFGEGYEDELPVHEVELGAFFMDTREVSGGLWWTVCAWGLEHGYVFENNGAWREPNHPVQTVSWHDAVKWCNARSEISGRTPVYYRDAEQTIVYRSGSLDLDEGAVKWLADGFRLPTEAEWEKGARGGRVAGRYPWGEAITGADANYWNSGDPFETGYPPATTPVGYFDGKQQPGGPDTANGYGLYDLAGNVWEWCWDRYAPDCYSQPAATRPDPKGPAGGDTRVLRGGGWNSDAAELRCAQRLGYYPPRVAGSAIGFRTVRAALVRPRLRLRVEGDLLLVRWPADADGFVLESAPRLAMTAAWTPVSGTVGVVGSEFSLTNRLAGATRFFRLRR